MEQEKALSLLNRQLTDLQSNADRILRGEDSSANVESFARYALELTKFIGERIENENLKAAALDIPLINYQRNQIQLWQYIILPTWWINIYKDYNARKKSLEEIAIVRGKFANLQLLVKELIE